jgi:hypothetical protein
MDIPAKALRELLARIAIDYDLDHTDLVERYIENPVPEPPKAPQVALCTALTAKGIPCKYKPQRGSCTCKIHAPKGNPEEVPNKTEVEFEEPLEEDQMMLALMKIVTSSKSLPVTLENMLE